jgi:hypothetical protein
VAPESAFNWDTIPAFLRSGPDGYAEGITGTLAILKLDVGFLVGQDGGEWGGWLRWYSDDGSHAHPILQENTSSIKRIGGQIVATTSALDGWSWRGALRTLARNKEGRWYVTETIALPGWPRSVSVTENDELLVATSEGAGIFYRGKLRFLPGKWHLLNPSSIVKISERIYIGMQSLVVELHLTPRAVVERWLVPRQCARFAGDDPPDSILGGWENCTCVPE